MTYLSLSTRVVIAAAVLICGGISAVQAQNSTNTPPATEADNSWYADEASPVQLTPRMIIQQKAQARAYQRMARMESMKWYGMSAARPQASTTPFMGIPSPRWQSTPGTPFAWYPRRSTNIYIVR